MTPEPVGLAEGLAELYELPRLVHHDVPVLVVPAELGGGDLVAVALEALIALLESLVRAVTLEQPLHVVDERHEGEALVDIKKAASLGILGCCGLKRLIFTLQSIPTLDVGLARVRRRTQNDGTAYP